VSKVTSPAFSRGELDSKVRALLDRPWRLLIGGRLVDARSGARYVDESPMTEAPIAEVADADAADVAVAVEAASAGFEVWRRQAPRARAKVVRELAGVLRAHGDELAVLDAIDGGNPVTAMRGDVEFAADLMEMSADWALELKGQTIPASAEHLHYTVREPCGIVARIVPFNHPIMFSAAKIAAPLVAGNAVILKAPHQTPLSALRMGELFADVLPPGVLTVLSGSGAATGDAVVRHPAVRRIAFIGSEPTGRAIQRAAAETGVKHVTLELGGKNALIACPDADPDRVADAATAGMNFSWSQGQSCGSTSRLLVHADLADEVIDGVRRRAQSIRIGSPLDPTTEMGTLVDRRQYDKVMRCIEIGRNEEAELVTGGGRPSGSEFDVGYYVAPTVFKDVNPQMRIAQEEIFGPVLSVLTWTDEREAVRIANGVAYGLTASIWTNDISRAHRLAREMQAGYVWINGVGRHFWGTPFGGYKASGLDREESLEEVLGFTQVKTVHVVMDEPDTLRSAT
jgi:2-formylbenzoate dehydrogenase